MGVPFVMLTCFKNVYIVGFALFIRVRRYARLVMVFISFKIIFFKTSIFIRGNSIKIDVIQFRFESFKHTGDEIDGDKIATFLCQECLDNFTKEYNLEDVISPIAIVDFSDGFLTPLQKEITAFAHSDYLAHLDFEEDGSVDMYFVYSPPRFQED